MKYYPIGTVVILKGGNRPLMIYGRKQIQKSANLIWDYVACLYPEGNISDKYTFFFQQEEIGKVLHLGYSSPYEDKMQELLNGGAQQRDSSLATAQNKKLGGTQNNEFQPESAEKTHG